MCRERQPPTPVPSVCVRARWRHACVESTRRNSACAALIMMRTFCRQRAPFPQAVSGSMMIFLSCRWVVARIRERIPEKKPGTVQLDVLLHRWTLLSCAILCEAWRSRAPARLCPHPARPSPRHSVSNHVNDEIEEHRNKILDNPHWPLAIARSAWTRHD